MKKTVLSLCTTLTAGILLHAQSISSADMPGAGSTFIFSTLSAQDIQNAGSYQASGNGISWDFSAFTASGSDTDAYVSPASVNPAYSLFFGLNAFGKRFTGNIGGGALPVSIENIYDFYDAQGSNFRRKGIGMTISGIPYPALYTQPDIVYELPLSYNDSYTHPFEFQLNVPTLGSLKRYGVRTSTVDGSGTLVTPAGTYTNCLRIRSEITQTDSILTQFGNFGIPSTSTEYTWLQAGTRAPLFSVTETGAAGQSTVTAARYLAASPNTSLQEAPGQEARILYPNPAGGQLYLSRPLQDSWSICNPAGQTLLQGKAPGINRLDISGLSPGTYFLRCGREKYTFIKQ